MADSNATTTPNEVPKILTPEEMEAEKKRKAEIAARFGGNIHNGGRKKAPATIIREMMEGEFASVTQKNMPQIAQKLLDMVHGEDANDRRFALKTLIDANNKIIDRSIEENKDDKGGQLVVNVNRGSVTVSKGSDRVKIDLSTSEDALKDVSRRIFEKVNSLPSPPEEDIEFFGEKLASDFFYNSADDDVEIEYKSIKDLENGLQDKEEKSS